MAEQMTRKEINLYTYYLPFREKIYRHSCTYTHLTYKLPEI